MLVCIDIGNTHIFGGVFIGDDIKYNFRYPSTTACTSDTLGIFLLSFFERKKLDIEDIEAVVLSSVVPHLEYSVNSACKKYLGITPLELKPGIKTGLKLSIKNPLDLGADRVANSVAAVSHFPAKNIIIVDFGTATTICAISDNKAYIGGAILPGISLSMDSLSRKTAKLSDVTISKPDSALGKTTISQIQSGLVYGQLGAIKEIVSRISNESFSKSSPVLIATGGYAHLFESEKYFDLIISDLLLHGLKIIHKMNK
ncbi:MULTISPECIES: type III pantothenate kinase [unclassified Francisella]|uniref:type III pantothenate kinase n=1 Tax=unclassified Francisella TaxID=2610885 RepID=UPI002E3582CE|nr:MULTISPECIES: type III pantothenate kinase [unclassified Francisella]MED7818352.1 type III pantothenate kinase [Francisella sp. 19S2-4]MED7829188.1 type III pantothenate kinase [Francisella sp. 19S2-10]